MRLSPQEFAQRLGTSPIPVLFADTCALLDIVRLPVRRTAATVRTELEAVRAIISAADNSSPAIHILLPEQVQREWGENIDAVESEVDKAIANWANQGEQFTSALAHFGCQGIPPNLDVACRQVAKELKRLATEVVARAIPINDDDACMNKGMRRVLCGSAPAQKGGQGKDCSIIEHVLAATWIIRAGSQFGSVFLSSNTKDYRQPNLSTELRSPLDTEFAAASLTFCTDWSWARRELGL